jgi:mono/diheme cytochrome c family protein
MSRSFALALIFSTLLPCVAQEAAVKKVGPRYTSPTSGPEMYQAYCASCHGQAGKGDGPVVVALKGAVPDLTTMAKRNGGIFPARNVGQFIRGEVVTPAHGSLDMPVWGPIFHSVSNREAAVVNMRVTNLTKHVESLQAK